MRRRQKTKRTSVEDLRHDYCLDIAEVHKWIRDGGGRPQDGPYNYPVPHKWTSQVSKIISRLNEVTVQYWQLSEQKLRISYSYGLFVKKRSNGYQFRDGARPWVHCEMCGKPRARLYFLGRLYCRVCHKLPTRWETMSNPRRKAARLEEIYRLRLGYGDIPSIVRRKKRMHWRTYKDEYDYARSIIYKLNTRPKSTHRLTKYSPRVMKLPDWEFNNKRRISLRNA